MEIRQNPDVEHESRWEWIELLLSCCALLDCVKCWIASVNGNKLKFRVKELSIDIGWCVWVLLAFLHFPNILLRRVRDCWWIWLGLGYMGERGDVKSKRGLDKQWAGETGIWWKFVDTGVFYRDESIVVGEGKFQATKSFLSEATSTFIWTTRWAWEAWNWGECGWACAWGEREGFFQLFNH